MHLLSFIISVWRNPALASSLACPQLMIFFEQDWQDIPKQAAASILGTISDLTNLLHKMMIYSLIKFSQSLLILQLIVLVNKTENKVQIFWEGHRNLKKKYLTTCFGVSKQRQIKLRYFFFKSLRFSQNIWTVRNCLLQVFL